MGRSSAGLWLLFLLQASPLLVLGQPSGCSCDSIRLVVDPACGADGQWYQNDCIAFCAGARVTDPASCTGNSTFSFSAGIGPIGAENDGASTVNASVVTAFAGEGYAYVGRIALVKEPAAPAVDPEPYATPDPDNNGNVVMRTVRCTPAGDVYVGSMAIPAAALQAVTTQQQPSASSRNNAAAAAAAQRRPAPKLVQAAQERGALWNADLDVGRPQQGTLAAGGPVVGPVNVGGGSADGDASASSIPPLAGRMGREEPDGMAATIAALLPGSSSGGSSSFAALPGNGSSGARRRAARRVGRRMAEVIGADERSACPQRRLPFSAVGQVEVVDPTGMFICTGTLIAADKVLTAGHCVWNIARGAFYFNLSFAPGRYRQGNSYVSPFGSIPWRSVTVFDAFKQNPRTWDVAVVTLSKPVGLVAGTVGLSTGCLRNTKLTIAGYPQDKPRGSCTTSGCTVPVAACNAPLASHTCDTVQGMSGAPMWDGSNRIRLIHIAGSSARPVNQGTAMTAFLVNAVSKW